MNPALMVAVLGIGRPHRNHEEFLVDLERLKSKQEDLLPTHQDNLVRLKAEMCRLEAEIRQIRSSI